MSEHIERDSVSRGFRGKNAVFAGLLLLAVLFASGGLLKRLGVEWSHRTVAMVMDYRDAASLARQGGTDPASLFDQLHSLGVIGIAAAEFTGRDLSNGVLPLKYGPVSGLPFTSTALANFQGDRATITIASKNPLRAKIIEYLKLRFHKLSTLSWNHQTVIILPGAVDEYGDSGLLPDFNALYFAEHVGAVALYRPAPAVGVGGEEVAASIAYLKAQFPAIKCIIPAGLVLAGYPEVTPIAETLNKLKISTAQVEFVKQIGTDKLTLAVRPNILPLHSLVREEVFSRRLTRAQIVDRMVRAVHERSIKILLVRPYDFYNAQRLPFFVEDIGAIHESLESRGYSFGWPETFPMWGRSLGGAIACAMILVSCAWFHWRRYRDEDEYANGDVDRAEGIALAVAIVALGLMAWKIDLVARVIGAFAAALTATEATLWALGRPDGRSRPFVGLVTGLLIVLAGGLVIASFYGTPLTMLRLQTFSGVKLTLLLPPLLVLLHDFRKKVYPEPLSAIIKRPPLWGELIICLALLGAAAIVAIRSDNAAYVSDYEIQFRELLERLLWIRPRTKEFLIGYPCLVLYYAVVKRGWLRGYREILRLGASIGFASSVNTFCHFHTLLPLSIIRVVNGWWLGIVVGFVLVVAMNIAAPFAAARFSGGKRY